MSQDQRRELDFDALNSYQDTIQAGRVSSLLFFFSGSNDSAAGTLGDLGDITVKYRGTTIINCSVQTLARRLNINKGQNLFESNGSGGSFKASCKVPFQEVSFPNALQVLDGSELKVEYRGTDGSVFSSLQATVFSQLSLLDMDYVPMFLGNDLTPGGSLNSSPEQLHQKNITSVYVEDPDDIVTELGFKQDGENVYDEQPYDVILAKTLENNQLEVTTFDMVEMQLFTDGVQASVFSDNNILQISTSGAGNVPVTYFAMLDPQQV